jgi:hypothetical protein
MSACRGRSQRALQGRAGHTMVPSPQHPGRCCTCVVDPGVRRVRTQWSPSIVFKQPARRRINDPPLPLVHLMADYAFRLRRRGCGGRVGSNPSYELRTPALGRRSVAQWSRQQRRKCHRYSSGTCPNRRSTCLSLNLPISKSVVRTNAMAPAWPNILQNPCARSIAAAGLAHSIGSPAAMSPSTKSKGNATKKVISAMGHRFAWRDN